MTAVVGILNKSGVAIAADSAVTISTGNQERKIYNSANKIFTLSKFRPVAIMIYSSASFNGIPWEILIKEYRKQLGDQSFTTLREYQSNFIKYLESKLDLIPKEYQDSRLHGFVEFIISNILETSVRDHTEELEILYEKARLKKSLSIIRELINNYPKEAKNAPKNEGFRRYSRKRFLNNYSGLIDKIINEYLGKLNLTKKDTDNILSMIFELVKSDQFFGNYTGLVFTGFGENEIFPSILPIRISEIFDNRMRYVFDVDNEDSISYSITASLRPFAQRDVIDLILSGADNQIQNVIYKTFDKFLEKFINIVAKSVEEMDDKLANRIRSIDSNSILKEFIEEIRSIQHETHISPLISTIASLSKEDLAELAESLIYLTYLKRRMSFSEESVGGPVDVAVITKGDGFIWIKRKHYFDPTLNHSFISNYFKTK